MIKNNVGIDDIGVYLPNNRISLDTIYQKRVADDPSQVRRLAKAIESTGQRAIRFPSYREDSVTMATEATKKVLDKVSPKYLAGIRHFVAATETTVDLSKPLSNYVLGILAKTSSPLPITLCSWQAQHACAAGTIGMVNVASQLLISGKDDESGIVVCSDIARYESPSSAEITQGAGSIALLLSKNPKLLELDLTSQGYASADVDDFFRPLDSITAKVKGQYSMQCYHEAANNAFMDHCARTGQTPAEVLGNHDYYVFHVPFAKMAYTAARSLITQHLHLVDGEVDEYLKPRGFFEPLEATSEVGNIYTGAAFLNLASLLSHQYALLGEGIIGKKILFSSYGSGNTMLILSMTIMPGAPDVISSWNLEDVIGNHTNASFEEYQRWIDKTWSTFNKEAETSPTPTHGAYLASIREDGYRVYEYQP